ncbi:hypothetical protein C2E23DRAFT_889017 [Lenzites betulinus]|nr:hypothetical protein C2E23DRAFT_889017 [Lenzites betulinus]
MAFSELFMLVAHLTSALAYIPAQAANASQATGVNFDDTSRLTLRWYPEASFADTVSYQLAGQSSTGITKGAFVHFSEDQLPNSTTTTPWIALISCDGNATQGSTDRDIFTLARERGAVAAVLYSLTSPVCQISPQFVSQARMNPILDIYTTNSLSSSALIENEFLNLDKSGEYYSFNPAALNASSSTIENVVVNHTVSGPGFMFATLTASNATDAVPSSGFGGSVPSSPPSTQNVSPKAGLPDDIIGIIAIVGAILVALCAVGTWRWYQRRWRRPSRNVTRLGHLSDRNIDEVADVETREAPLVSGTLTTAASDSAATRRSFTGLDSAQADSQRVLERVSRRVRFSSGRLVRPLGDQPEFELLNIIEEVKR